MKMKRIGAMLLAVLLVAGVFVFNAGIAVSADETEAAVAVRENVVSDPVDALGLAGTRIGSASAHGNNQNRVVRTSSGTYLGVMTAKYGYECYYEMSLIRVNDDRSCELLYVDFIETGSTTVTVMADANEDIWLYAGWVSSGDYWCFNVYHYDVSENTTVCYCDFVRDDISGFGYSVGMMDTAKNRIYAFMPGGDLPGYIGVAYFDIASSTWSMPVVLNLDVRCCYLYTFLDQNGGLVIVGERDILNKSVITDNGKSVASNIPTLRSRKINANYMWDELYIISMPDPDKAEYTLVPLELADYDVLHGLYPNNRNNTCGDAFVDKNGLLHVFYQVDDDASFGAGKYSIQKIYDMNDGMKLLYTGMYYFIYGDGSDHWVRMCEDLEGNLYLINSHETSTQPLIEIWQATDELGSQFKLVAAEVMENKAPGSGAMIIANNRNNSTPSDVVSLILSANDTWYEYEVDLGALRRQLAK